MTLVPDKPDSAMAIAQKVRDGEWSATEVLERYLTQIHRYEDDVHAFNTVLTERARVEARKTDERVASGEDVGALAGVPVAIKDNLCTKGIPTTASSRILKDWEPPYDATVVRKLYDAGATLIGKRNMD